MIYKITPFDTVFFRDAKPFSRGSDVFANSIYPPLPSVYTGAIRSAFFSNNMDSFKYAGEDNDPSMSVQIGLTCLLRQNTILLPAPADLAVVKNKDKSLLKNRTLNDFSNISTYPLKKILSYSSKKDDDVSDVSSSLYISLEQFNHYINDGLEMYDIYNITDFITAEHKIGIAKNKISGTCENSMLYQIKMIRPFDENNIPVEMLVDVNALKLPEKGILKLGGEAKAASYMAKKEGLKINQCKIGEGFKLYFTAPSIFENGWLPSFIDKKTFKGTYESDGIKVNLELEAAAFGKFITVGGFDMKLNRPKPMKRAIPAGSVYYFKILDGKPEDVLTLFNGKNISDYNAFEGFGHCYVCKI